MLYKLISKTCALMVFLAIGVSVRAQKVYTPEQVPNVQLSDSTQFVSDPSGLLSPHEQASLNQELASLRSRYAVETALVILPSIGERSIEEFSVELFRHWGLGDKKVNNGLLWILVLDQRKVRFEVGYGLEGVLTDLESRQIQRREMLPHFRRGDYASGLMAGAKALETLFAKATDLPQGERKAESSGENKFIHLFYLYLIFGFIVSLWLLGEFRVLASYQKTPRDARANLPSAEQSISRSIFLCVLLSPPMAILLWWYGRKILQGLHQCSSLCPHCQKQTMFRTSSNETWESLTPNQKYETKLGSRAYRLFRCNHCGQTELTGQDLSSDYAICTNCQSRAVKSIGEHQFSYQGKTYIRTTTQCLCCGHQDHNDRRDHSAEEAATAAILLGALAGASTRGRGRGGSWSGGGGFSGGSWGGGSSGGGGATSSW